MSLNPLGRRKSSEEDIETFLAIYHGVPMTYGGQPDLPEPLAAPPAVDIAAARQPTSPGPLPIQHVLLPQPAVLRLSLPPLQSDGDEAALPPLTSKQKAALPGMAVGAGPDADEKPYTRPAWLEAFDPLYALALYLALGIGTILFMENLEIRYTVLWSALIGVGGLLTLFETPRRPGRITITNLTWGLFIGLVIGLPLLVTVSQGLAETASILFPYANLPTLFRSLVFIGPLGETLFFRGRLQERHGIATSIIGAGLGNVIFFWPAVAETPVYLAALIVFYTVLAGIYSFLRARNGLSAALVCQATINMLLIFAPELLR
jgi:membrane protease YdiL (CAAX protease family)